MVMTYSMYSTVWSQQMLSNDFQSSPLYSVLVYQNCFGNFYAPTHEPKYVPSIQFILIDNVLILSWKCWNQKCVSQNRRFSDIALKAWSIQQRQQKFVQILLQESSIKMIDFNAADNSGGLYCILVQFGIWQTHLPQ